jgi:diguanylate cyclase (GGDEF)-like protein
MTDHPAQPGVAALSHKVASLNAQAADLRAELLKLRKQIADVESDLSDTQTARLQEANQKLVLAVLQADSIASVAVASLAAMAASNQRDELTGLPNRSLGLDRLENAIEMARRNEKRLAILFVDLDHFKLINDQLGHASGDVVLQLVAKRLKSVLRDSDTVSRYGGDEFLILLPEVSQASDAGQLACELLATLCMPATVDGHNLQLSSSIGISMYPEDGDNPASLIDRADEAMYRCKRSGDAGFHFYAEQSVEELERLPRMVQQTPKFNGTAPAVSTLQQQDLREANEQLVMSSLAAQESEAQATAAQRQQLKFMAMVAHELRNPMTPLRLAAEMLANPSSADELSVARLVLIITSQVARMARLIDDLLDGSRLSTGKLRLEFDSVDLVGILEQTIVSCRSGMQTRRQHLSNLLDNAGKYTPEGGEISLGMTASEHEVSISVRDNGLGIAADMLSTIFDMFVQDARVFSHSSGGLGIGLAVVRDLVEAHGGTVIGRSEGHHLGSEFVVTLPLA